MFYYRVYVKGYFFIHVPDFQCGRLQNNTVVFGDNAYYNTDRLMNERGVDMCSVAVKIPDEVLYDTKMTEAVHKITSLLDIVRSDRMSACKKHFVSSMIKVCYTITISVTCR